MEESSILRFFEDKTTKKITKCDFLGNTSKLYGNASKLLESLNNDPLKEDILFYLCQIYKEKCKHNIYKNEEKDFGNEKILFKIYGVKEEELEDIIKRIKIALESKELTHVDDTEDLTQADEIEENTEKYVQTQVNISGKKVRRRNRFKNITIKVTLATLLVLLGIKVFSMLPMNPNQNINTPTPTPTSITQIDDIKTKAHKFVQITKDDTDEISVNNFDSVLETMPEETSSPTIEELSAPIVEETTYDQYLFLETEDWTSTDKYIFCKENYYNLITQYAEIYGIDPQVALGIACHERGVHSEKVDSGGGLGLYQVQIEGVWDNQDVKAYNFEENSWETYTIHKDEICKLENNIKAGLMIFQEDLKRNDYDIAKAIQEYNYGCGWMGKVMKACYTENNPKTEFNKYEWMNYRNIISGGDPKYVENIFKYIEDESVLEFVTPDGTIITCKFDNLAKDNVIKK